MRVDNENPYLHKSMMWWTMAIWWDEFGPSCDVS